MVLFKSPMARADPEWIGEHADPEWLEKYSRRIEDYRLPKGKEARTEYLKTVGTDGMRLLAHIEAPYAPQSLIRACLRSKYCAGTGSSTTRGAMERYGFRPKRGA